MCVLGMHQETARHVMLQNNFTTIFNYFLRPNWEEDQDFMEDERDVEYGSWNRNDLFRLEKGIMAFGWGRWEEVLNHAELRKGWNFTDVEVCRR